MSVGGGCGHGGLIRLINGLGFRHPNYFNLLYKLYILYYVLVNVFLPVLCHCVFFSSLFVINILVQYLLCAICFKNTDNYIICSHEFFPLCLKISRHWLIIKGVHHLISSLALGQCSPILSL